MVFPVDFELGDLDGNSLG